MKTYTLPLLNEEVDTVVLANGEFPTHPIPLSILHRCKYLVCCDGAVEKLVSINKIPDAIVGDCDSISEEKKLRFADIIEHISEQETNDLTKAVTFCILQGRKNIVILGATGHREDHTLGNISLLCEYMKKAEVKMISNFGVFVAIDSPSKFESLLGQQVSIFCIDSANLTSQNLLYPIKNKRFSNWWQATLNEAISNSFELDIDGRTIVYRAFPTKI